MATPKPTIILVPGAWHGPDAFSPIISLLEPAGYKCKKVELPSVGHSSPQPENFDPDVEAIRSAITSSADAEEDVILFMHSYGGIPGSEAVKGLDKASRRADGKLGGVSHLFFCTAFALAEGVSLIDGVGGQPPPWFRFSENETAVFPHEPEKVFYNDITDPDTLETLKAGLKTHAYRSMASKQTYAAWKDVESTYLLCKKDQAIPLEGQEGMCAQKGWKKLNKVVLDSSHTPFWSMPKETAEAVRRAAGEVF